MHGCRLLFNVKDVKGALLNTPGLGSEFTEFEKVLDAYLFQHCFVFSGLRLGFKLIKETSPIESENAH